MNLLDKSKWIWCNHSPDMDEYGEFIDKFQYKNSDTYLYISADSNYTVYINGEIAAFGQYSDFPYDKVYDKIDIGRHCKAGENILAIRVWYYGLETSQVYYKGNAGLIYTVADSDAILCKSDENTLSRMSKAYINHRKKIITGQLGFSYCYDSAKEDNWINGEIYDFKKSSIVNQALPLRERPIKRLEMLNPVIGKPIKTSDNTLIYDLGKECVGFLKLSLYSEYEQEITVAYGEHLEDGCVRRIIANRDFSILYRAKKGENEFLNTFRRFGCRYLEISFNNPIEIKEIAIVPTVYPLKEKPHPILNDKQKIIYEMCIETLKLCMHEHYEDCPWREQALYTMDSRNQMLCGYYAFGETVFPRANLELISKDNREDGLLSICYPMSGDLVIPSFSLHYFTECREYMDFTGDKDFIKSIYPKLQSILSAFTNRLENGLVNPFKGSSYWNFYEWRDGLDDMHKLNDRSDERNSSEPDIILNAMLSIALQNMAKISDALCIKHSYTPIYEAINSRITDVFFSKEKGLFADRPTKKTYSQLGNSLAILCGAATNEQAKEISKKMLADTDITPISLSMNCFKYDALLKTDKELYKDIILADIDRIYTPMIEYGSTTVWETELGEKDFEDAGSLCHGWSALPVYYYNILF